MTTAFLQTRARQSHLAGEYVRLVEKACGSAAGREPLVLSAPPKAGTREVLNLVKRHHLPRAGWIALGPGATYGPAKRWPLPYWKQVMESLLASRSESLLILGGREEKEYLKPLAESF
ncbi:MAG: glycosyltransferase family 9 protein [bacterium]